MVVMEDYEIDNVPGFGTLKVGTLETRPAALTAALSDTAKLKLIRIKNSWGNSRADRQFVVPGYHDLYMTYLNGPLKECTQTPEGTSILSQCHNGTPLNDVVIPPGY